jgi:mRNA interferase RelE/StbE
MSYKLAFLEIARKEWDKLAHSTREQFKKKLEERLENPHVPASRLSGSQNRYKIKLRSAGYRLVYEVRDEVLVVIVIAVGKRDKNLVYKAAEKR